MKMPFPVADSEPVTPESVPEAYRAAAKTMLERDRKSYAAFRAVDQAEHERDRERRLAVAVAAAEREVSLFRMDVEALEPAAGEALEALRAAEDRARGAREYARTQEAEAAKAREDGSAEEATSAQVRADTADGVAAEREVDAVKAREELDGLERDLGEARENLGEAERGLRAARKAAEVPAGTAPVSGVTMRACSGFMQRDEVWDQLPDQDRRRVLQAAEPRNPISDREWNARMRNVFQNAAGS